MSTHQETQTPPKCQFGLDAVHEALARPKDDPLALPPFSDERRAARDALFVCHYGARPCPWQPTAP